MKPKIGATARGGVCLGGSLNEAARRLKSTHVKETIQILDVDELRSTCAVLLIHPKLNDFTALLLSAGIVSTSTCNDAIECIDSLESCLPAHAMLPPSLIRAILQMAHTNKQQASKRKASGDDCIFLPLSPLLERVCLGDDMSLDACVSYQSRTTYTVTVYALLGLWEGSQSHGERLFTTLLSSNVEKYIVTTRTFKSLLTCNTDKALVEIHGETLPIEVALRAVNLMGNLLRISHEVVLDAWIGLLSLLLVQLPLSNGNGNILPLPRLLCKFSRELAVATARLKQPCMRWEEAVVKAINTLMGLQTGVDTRTRLERQLASPTSAIQILHYAVFSTNESAALRSAAMTSVEKSFQDNLLHNFSDHDKKILVQILMEVAEQDGSAAVRAAAMQAIQCCPLEMLFTVESKAASSNMMIRLFSRLCDIGATVSEHTSSVLLKCGHYFMRCGNDISLLFCRVKDEITRILKSKNTLCCGKVTSTLLRRLLVHANTINQCTDVPIADIATAIILASAAGFHVCSCCKPHKCRKALLLPTSLNASSSNKPVPVCSLAHLDFDFYAYSNKLQALDELLSRLTVSKSKWERWQLRAGSSPSILTSLGSSKRLMYEYHGD